MSLDPVSLSAFRSELSKIAGKGNFLGNWVRKGWSDVGGKGARGGWMGKKDTWRRHLPIGGKSITVGLTAATLPGALQKEDPLGRERSRLHRVAQLGAGTLGGLAGVGAVMKPGGIGFLRSAAGGIGGSIVAERLVSKPFQRARQERLQGGPLSPEDRSNLLGQSVSRAPVRDVP